MLEEIVTACLRRAIMSYVPENALIIQSDRSVLLEVHSPRADAARDAVALCRTD